MTTHDEINIDSQEQFILECSRLVFNITSAVLRKNVPQEKFKEGAIMMTAILDLWKQVTIVMQSLDSAKAIKPNDDPEELHHALNEVLSILNITGDTLVERVEENLRVANNAEYKRALQLLHELGEESRNDIIRNVPIIVFRSFKKFDDDKVQEIVNTIFGLAKYAILSHGYSASQGKGTFSSPRDIQIYAKAIDFDVEPDIPALYEKFINSPREDSMSVKDKVNILTAISENPFLVCPAAEKALYNFVVNSGFDVTAATRIIQVMCKYFAAMEIEVSPDFPINESRQLINDVLSNYDSYCKTVKILDSKISISLVLATLLRKYDSSAERVCNEIIPRWIEDTFELSFKVEDICPFSLSLAVLTFSHLVSREDSTAFTKSVNKWISNILKLIKND